MKDPNNVLQKALAKNEPVFVLRAQDKCALAGITAYVKACIEVGCSIEHIVEATGISLDFLTWMNANPDKLKIPD